MNIYTIYKIDWPWKSMGADHANQKSATAPIPFLPASTRGSDW